MASNAQRAAAAVEAFARGDMVVVVDDDDREGEGDIIVAAVHATPEKLAFIVRHTSGIVCTPITQEIADRLRLPPMVQRNDDPHATAFTVTIDYKVGFHSGISAAERTATARALANPNVGADDFIRPGHIFPLVAREGGVLIRSGHTEAAVDLCKLAGLAPVGVICELVNDDGTVKRGAEVTGFAAEHGLAFVSVADIIALRQQREQLITRVGEATVQTSAGLARAVSFSTPFDPIQHLALVFGDISGPGAVPVRIQRERVLEDVFSADSSLDQALAAITAEGRGVVLYLRDGGAGVAASAVRHAAPEPGSEHHASAEQRAEDWREVGLGAQILRDLGVRTIKVLTSKERRYVGLEGFGIAIEGTQRLG